MHGRDYNKLYEELENDPVTRMPSDGILPRYSFDKTFKTSITDRDAWKRGPPINAEIAVYTDGSKTDEGAGAGIYGTKPKMKISLSLGKHATIFQAEIVAIHHCAQELIRHDFSGKNIVIYSDSQAAIKAVNSMQVTSKLVWDCIDALKELGSQNRLTLAWVPAHTGYRGNEEADTLAREGASKALNGPEPYCGIAKAVLKTNTKSWIQQKSQEWWNNAPGMRQAKEFIKQPLPTFTDYLLSQKRNTTRIVVGLLTGHCRLNKHMSTIGLAEEMLCRFCQEEEETSVHILCHCEGLSRQRFLTLGEEKPRAPKFMGVLRTSLWSLVKKTGLDKEL